MLEAHVHQQLRAFLREQPGSPWPHHLTLARLVARALRVGRSALIERGTTGPSSAYRWGYLMAVLLWPGGVVLVAPEATLQELMAVDLPPLQEWLGSQKPVVRGDRWPRGFGGLLLTTPQVWLDALAQDPGAFPPQIPILIEGADDLEQWFIQSQTLHLGSQDWQSLTLACPHQGERVRDARVRLTHALFQRPNNVYNRCLLEEAEQILLRELHQALLHPVPSDLGRESLAPLPPPWVAFQRQLALGQGMTIACLDRQQGTFNLEWSPLEVAPTLRPYWNRQPVVLLRDTLGGDSSPSPYQHRLGIEDLTLVQFGLDRHTEQLQLYLPEHLPLPNTPHFHRALLVELRRLLTLSATAPGFTVILINDQPLQSQVGATLAAEFGSRVRLERLPESCPSDSPGCADILISGWEFWRQHQNQCPPPQLLAMATLPLPSLEDPRVAGQVAHYKQQGQDWFRCYLLPQALMELQRAIAPVRRSQGVFALLDLRVLHRSYGQQILTILSPMARLGYLDPSLFSPQDCLV